MKLGTIIKNHWAGENNPYAYFIYTGIKGNYATGIGIFDGKVEKREYYKNDFKKIEIFEPVGFCDYQNFIKSALNEAYKKGNIND